MRWITWSIINLPYTVFRCRRPPFEVLVGHTCSGYQRMAVSSMGEYVVVRQARRKQESFTSRVRVRPQAHESGVINLHYCPPTVACASVKLVEACSSSLARQADKSFSSDWLYLKLWSIQTSVLLFIMAVKTKTNSSSCKYGPQLADLGNRGHG